MSQSCNVNTVNLINLENRLIEKALCYLENRFYRDSITLNSIQSVSDYLRLHLASERNEVFAALFLDSQKCLIKFEKLFFGTIDEVSAHPRVLVQKALDYNAHSIILAHNHPSGNLIASRADKELTRNLVDALKLVEIKILDHFIVTAKETFSFLEAGLI